MNRKNIIIAAATFGLLGLTACTPEEISKAITASDLRAGIVQPAIVPAVEPAVVQTSGVTSPADCPFDGAVVHVVGGVGHCDSATPQMPSDCGGEFDVVIAGVCVVKP